MPLEVTINVFISLQIANKNTILTLNLCEKNELRYNELKTQMLSQVSIFGTNIVST